MQFFIGFMSPAIEHSENKVVRQSGPFETEIGPGVLQSSFHQICQLQECQRHKV